MRIFGIPSDGAPRRALSLTIALALTCGVSAPALAQGIADAEGGEAPAGDAAQGNSIVVTAMRRASTVQETPIAITAITGETLTNAGVTNITEYAKFVPSLRIQDNGPGSRRVSLRGVIAPGEPTVGTYYNDVPATGSVGPSNDAAGRTGDFTLFDIERVEVLRGPQGTLYGASSMGGAIRVIFNRASYEYEGAVEAQLGFVEGGDPAYFVNGMVNVPLVEDKLAVRFVAYQHESAGWIDNQFLGIKNINDLNVTGGRLSVHWDIAPGLTLDTMSMYEETQSFGTTVNPDLGEYVTADQVLLPYDDKAQFHSATLEYDLGFATLAAVGGYQKRVSEYAADDSYYIGRQRTPQRCATYTNGSASAPCSADQLAGFYSYIDGLIPAAIYYPGTNEDLTGELRLSSNGLNMLDWTVGVFYQDRSSHVEPSDARADAETGAIIRPVQLFYRRQLDDTLKQTAAFGEVTFHPVPEIGLTAGLRYYDYDKRVVGWTDIPWSLISAIERPPTTVDASENGTLLKFNASWEPNPDTLFYATAAQGYRPGGANQVIGLPDDLTPYEADTLWNYEVGAKFTLGGRTTLNMAAFQIDWDNIQVRGRTPDGAFSFLSNAGAARIRGLELEAATRPVMGLTLTLAGNYLDAKLTEDQVSDVITAPGQSGDRLADIPRWNGTLSAEYTTPVSSDADFFARADVNYVGPSNSELVADSPLNVVSGDYSLTNLRVGVEWGGGDTGAYLFVQNLFDAFALTRGTNAAYANGFRANVTTPRTIGVNVRRNF
ncbi:ligand-gated channel protein [Altererythrobacter sp. B11]|uniref:TonB-dependent receptor n=1 Tax=Altererythrobacter sp. B11 TaxID=2060312 RepID=UPI000DC6F800|nr:TonB-dependent receptor [Altererythrobacter sp. B11]BBC73388.1 ligand-gated channel protein [Altererythrobacter sp. B11]